MTTMSVFFFFNDTATTEIYTLSLHDALPISCSRQSAPLQELKRKLHETAEIWPRGPGKARPAGCRRPDPRSVRPVGRLHAPPAGPQGAAGPGRHRPRQAAPGARPGAHRHALERYRSEERRVGKE